MTYLWTDLKFLQPTLVDVVYRGSTPHIAQSSDVFMKNMFTDISETYKAHTFIIAADFNEYSL